MRQNVGIWFIVTGILALLAGLLMGSLGALHFMTDSAVNTGLPFYKLRPLHVTLVLSWVLLTAIGGVYYYLPRIYRHNRFAHRLSLTHYVIFVMAGFGILFSFLFGKFEGREYFEFPAYFFYPVFAGWLIFLVVIFSSVNFSRRPMPVYIWMWLIGSVFMIFNLIEANLWHIPHFGHTIVRDITIQWKSNGALVGSWNMLVYGTATYLMTRIHGDKSIATKPLAYAMFFLGFTNLLFNWGHHVYPLPGITNIKIISYAISMTELIILGKIIRDWRLQKPERSSNKFKISVQLLELSEFWVFLNLSLAIVMSIPAINVYTHGTHITVAHSMGTTIGINSIILLASVFYIFERPMNKISADPSGAIRIFHAMLLVFWGSLIVAGLIKGILTQHSALTFQEIMHLLTPFLVVFTIAGIVLFLAMIWVVKPILQVAYQNTFQRK